MKPETKKYLLFILTIIVIIYLAIAFITGELDASCWDQEARSALVAVVGVLSFFRWILLCSHNNSGDCNQTHHCNFKRIK